MEPGSSLPYSQAPALFENTHNLIFSGLHFSIPDKTHYIYRSFVSNVINLTEKMDNYDFLIMLSLNAFLLKYAHKLLTSLRIR